MARVYGQDVGYYSSSMTLHTVSGITIFYIVEWTIRIGAFFVVPRNRKPTAAMSWLMLIMLEPVLGLAVFLLIGSPKLSRKRRDMQTIMDQIITTAVEEASSTPSLRKYVHFEVPKRFQPIVDLNTNLGRMPAFSGNKVELLPHYDATIRSIIKDVQTAHDFVHLEFFVISYDDCTEKLFTALAEAVKRSVKVRVMLDALGSRQYPNFRLTKKKLTEIGVEWQQMLPIGLPGRNFNRPDLRNHRKIVIIDGTIGYTGSQNLIRRNYHRKDALHYDELMVRLQGPIVAQLHGTFITDWYSETSTLLSPKAFPETKLNVGPAGSTLAQVLPSGPGYDNENNLKLFTSLIHAASTKITIVNPYFVPDSSLLTAITSAAQRGVEVSMINSEIMDQRMVGHAQRSYYEQLLQSGVKIFLYKYPILLHSKFIMIDDDMAVIGSSNLDIRSFQLNLEVSLIVYDREVVQELHALKDSYLVKSEPLDLETWQARPWRYSTMDNLARLTASLQ
jgi:cardiolipin synthase